MYGAGRTTEDPRQAGQWAQQARGDRQHWRTLTRAAYDVLRDHDRSDDDRLAVIGFCFGGGTAVELAYANPPGLRAAVSFHGGPLSPLPADGKPDAAVLILHGANDPLDKPSRIMQLTEQLTTLGATWQLHLFSGAQHSFMNPGADAHNIPGVAYHERTARRAWDQMQLFFDHAFSAD
jgi:dienelactone hydrolase